MGNIILLLIEKVFFTDIEEKYTKDYPLTLCLNFEMFVDPFPVNVRFKYP